MLRRALLVPFLVALVTKGFPQLTLLDPTFGSGGMVLLGLSGFGGDMAEDVAVLPGGQILVAGKRSGIVESMIVLRLQENGAVDPGFGAGGVAAADYGGDSEAHALVVQPDGSVVIAGDAEFPGVFDDLAIARFTSSGQLDPTFSGDGKWVHSSSGANDALFAVSIAPDGRVVASGKVEGGVEPDMVAVRLTAEGDPDPSFSADGIYITTEHTGEIAEDHVLRADGRIVLCGALRLSLPDADMAMLQLTADGSPDPAFGVGGLFRPQEAISVSSVTSAIELVDGRILIAGKRYLPGGGTQEVFTGRVMPDGSWDTGYGVDGRSFLALGAGNNGVVRDMVLLPDGRAVVAVDIQNGPSASVMALRVLPDGGLDNSFGDNGRVLMPCPGDGCTLQSLALDASGRVLAAGSYITTLGPQIMVMRWLSEASGIGMAEGGADRSISVFPVPSSGDLWLRIAEGVLAPQQAELLDGAGRTVHVFGSGELLSRQLMVPASVVDGTYLLRLVTRDGMAALPVVLRR